MRENLDPYAVLGVAPTATQAEVTHAYRAQLRALHPDTRNASAQAVVDSDARLRRVLAAYTLLRDPERRAHYDRTAERSTTTSPASAHMSANPQRPIQIPVTHHRKHSKTPPGARPPLWVGPVHQHH